MCSVMKFSMYTVSPSNSEIDDGGADIILDISEVQAKTLSVLQRAHIAKRYLDSSFIIPYMIIVENSFEFLDAHIGPFTTIKHLILDSSK